MFTLIIVGIYCLAFLKNKMTNKCCSVSDADKYVPTQRVLVGIVTCPALVVHGGTASAVEWQNAVQFRKNNVCQVGASAKQRESSDDTCRSKTSSNRNGITSRGCPNGLGNVGNRHVRCRRDARTNEHVDRKDWRCADRAVTKMQPGRKDNRPVGGTSVAVDRLFRSCKVSGNPIQQLREKNSKRSV